MLDKGVSERELEDDEKPWLIMQRNRRVSHAEILIFSFNVIYCYFLLFLVFVSLAIF